MKKFLIPLFALFTTPALAGSPCIFGGAYVKCFPTGGIKLENGQGLVITDGAFTGSLTKTDDAAVPGLFSATTHTTVDGSNNAIGLQLSALSSVDTGAYNDKATGAFIATVGRSTSPGGDDAGHLDSIVGAQVLLQMNSDPAGLTDKVYGFSSAGIIQHGTITDMYDFFGIGIPAGDATVTNHYGMYLDYAGALATNEWGVFAKGSLGDATNYTGFHVDATASTVSGEMRGFEDSSEVTTTAAEYKSAYFHPTLAEVTSTFNGVTIEPTAVGDGSASGVGLFVNMNGVTNFGAGNVKAITTNGDVNFNGVLTAAKSYTLTDGGGNPTALHSIGTVFESVADTANVDKFGFSPSMNVHIDDGVTATSGSFGVGATGLGMLNFFQMDTGSSLDFSTGSFVAMIPTSGDGTVGTMAAYRAIGAALGGTVTVDNMIGFKFDLPTGPFGTDSWGFYDSAAEYNWFKNSLQIGGDAGMTDRVANASVGLGVLGKAIYPVPMDTTTRDGLTPLEGMLVNNSTTGDLERYDGAIWTAVGGGGGGGMTIGDAVSGGNNGSLLFVDGSGNLGQSTTMVVGGMGEVCFGSTSCGQKVSVTGQFGITGTSTNTVIFNGSGTQPSSYNLTLPDDDGDPGEVLTTDGTGTLNWSAALSLGNPINGGSPGGILFADPSNNLGQDGGSFVWDAMNGRLGIGTNTPSAKLSVEAASTGISVHTSDGSVHLNLLNDALDSIGIRVPSAITSGYDLILPPDPGTADQVLRTDGLGETTWVDVANPGPHTIGTATSAYAVTAVGGVAPAANQYVQTIYVVGDGGPVVVTATPPISGCATFADEGIKLVIIGTDATNTVTMSGALGSGVEFNGATATFGAHTIVSLICDGDEGTWIETSRNGL